MKVVKKKLERRRVTTRAAGPKREVVKRKQKALPERKKKARLTAAQPLPAEDPLALPILSPPPPPLLLLPPSPNLPSPSISRPNLCSSTGGGGLLAMAGEARPDPARDGDDGRKLFLCEVEADVGPRLTLGTRSGRTILLR